MSGESDLEDEEVPHYALKAPKREDDSQLQKKRKTLNLLNQGKQQTAFDDKEYFMRRTQTISKRKQKRQEGKKTQKDQEDEIKAIK